MMEYTGLRENSRNILERQSPKKFIEIWKDVSLRLHLKDKVGNQQYAYDFLILIWGQVEVSLKKRRLQKMRTLK